MKKTSPFKSEDDEVEQPKQKQPEQPSQQQEETKPSKDTAKDDDSSGTPKLGNDRRPPGKAAESSRAKKVANDMKKALKGVETDDMNAAAGAAAEAVMSGK